MRIILKSCTRAGKLPPERKKGRTTFIPEPQEASSPRQFRPITVTSLWIKHLNKISARKLSAAIKLTNSQLGSQTLDGTAIAITRLNSAFRYAKINSKPISVVTIDFEKAFDSVSHNSIMRSLKRYSVPHWLNSLIKDSYSNSTATIMNSKANINRGIKHGDPLSPILFNMVANEILEDLGNLKLCPKNANFESGCHGITVATDGHPETVMTIDELQWSLSTGKVNAQISSTRRPVTIGKFFAIQFC